MVKPFFKQVRGSDTTAVSSTLTWREIWRRYSVLLDPAEEEVLEIYSVPRKVN